MCPKIHLMRPKPESVSSFGKSRGKNRMSQSFNMNYDHHPCSDTLYTDKRKETHTVRFLRLLSFSVRNTIIKYSVSGASGGRTSY